jgi:membrane protein DedA with SNARE-associated domain
MSKAVNKFDQNGVVQSFVTNYGYFAIFVLAMMESMCIPVPSEVIFIFGGASCTAAVAHLHPLGLGWVIAIGVLGELLGAIVAYTVGRTLGRTIVDRWGKWLLLTHHDLDRGEEWFKKYGPYSIVIGRVIPIVRSVISVPAGLAEMGRVRFLALTALGSAIWVAVLTTLGYKAGQNWDKYNKFFHTVQYPVIAIVVLALGFGFWHRWNSVKKHSAH